MEIDTSLITKAKKLLSTEVLGRLNKDDKVKITPIPQYENKEKFDYYFNKNCFLIITADLAKDIYFKIVNNYDIEKVMICAADLEYNFVFNVMNKEDNYIILESNNSIKVKFEKIYNYEQTVLFISKDQGITWHYIELSDIINK